MVWKPGNALVIDNGSGIIKAGWVGHDSPLAVFDSLLGSSPHRRVMMSKMPTKTTYIGDEAQNLRGVLTLRYAMEHGKVTDWDDMEAIWNHLFSVELRADTTEQPIMLCEAPFNSKPSRERSVEIMFDKFNVPSTYLSNQGVLSLMASGRTTGVVVGSGDGVTYTLPVYEGYSLTNAVSRLDWGGRDITAWMARLLSERGHFFTTTAEQEIVRNLKEKLCYVVHDFEKELKILEEDPFSLCDKRYELPDGQVIMVGTELFRCAESMFRPSLLGLEAAGIHQRVFDSITKCDLDLRKELYQNIILSGGSTMFDGFPERLQKDVVALAPFAPKVRVCAPPERKYSVWIGGTILASLSTFEQAWISKQEFSEFGSSIVHRKC